MINLRRTATLLLSALVLAGCGYGRLSTMPEPDPSGAATTRFKGPVQTVTADDAGLQFEVPASWQDLDPDLLQSPSATRYLKAAADALGVSVEELKRQMASVDALVVDPTGNNVNVTPGPTSSGLPSESAITEEYENLNLDVSSVTDQETPLGTVRVARVSIEVMGQPRYAAAAFVVVDGRVAIVTITGTDGPSRDELVEQVLPTLGEVDPSGSA